MGGILGLSKVVTLSNMPKFSEYTPKIVPCLVHLFDKLKKENAISNDDNEYDDVESGSDYDDSEEDDDAEEKYRKRYDEEDDEKSTEDEEDLAEVEESESGDDDDDYEVSGIDAYLTPLDKHDSKVDEYQVFKYVMQTIENQDNVWYNKLLEPLSEKEMKTLQESFSLADEVARAEKDGISKENDNKIGFEQSLSK